MGKKKPTSPSTPTDASTNTMLAALLAAKGFTASTSEAVMTPVATVSGVEKELDLSRTGKIVVRREKKGRGGKTVTLVSGIGLPTPRLEAIARAMRKGLGCGSQVEPGGVIVIQGDIPDRAQDWLRKHGATKIVQGN